MRFLVILAILGVVLVGGFVITTSDDWARAQDTENTEQEDVGAEAGPCASPVASPSASPEASPSLALASTPAGSPEASPSPCAIGTPAS
jgi:hypothetical protein